MPDHHYYFDGNRYYHSSLDFEWLHNNGISPKTILEFGFYDCGDTLRYRYQYRNSGIYACDPDSFSYQRAIGLNIPGHGIKLFNIAFSDHEGEIPFYKTVGREIPRLSPTGGFYPIKKSERNNDYSYIDNPINVPCRRIDSFCHEHNIQPDFIHMDTEGYIIPVLKGFGDIAPKAIWIECYSAVHECPNKIIQIKEFFNTNGYRQVAEEGNDKLFIRN